MEAIFTFSFGCCFGFSVIVYTENTCRHYNFAELSCSFSTHGFGVCHVILFSLTKLIVSSLVIDLVTAS